jgi:SAM-dependent methyltransferase
LINAETTSVTNPAPAPASRQVTSNASEWAAGKHLATYDNRVLTPAEVQIFIRYHEKLAGRVLDVGCGAGRVLAYLLMIGAEAHGVDLAPKMVDHCRSTLPEADVRVGDASKLKDCVEGPFDVVIAPDCLIDVFDDSERRQVIADIRDLLTPDGLFIFSSHDLGFVDAPHSPPRGQAASLATKVRKLVDKAPADVPRAIRRRREIARNRKRLAPLEQRNGDHAILNDVPHNYSFLHYFIRRDDQERQLQEVGYELVECLGADGRTVAPGGSGPTDTLHYIARAA